MSSELREALKGRFKIGSTQDGIGITRPRLNPHGKSPPVPGFPSREEQRQPADRKEREAKHAIESFVARNTGG